MEPKTKLHEEDGNLYVTRHQDVTPVLEYAKAMHNEGFHGHADSRYVGTIPGVVIEAWCHAKGVSYRQWCSDEEVRKRFLNDPDYANFRIWKGKV